MGRSIRRAFRPARTARQSTARPRTCTCARAVVRVRASGRSARSTGAKTTSSATALSWPRAQSTPSGPNSTKVRTPSRSRACTASPKRTASRTWRTQYSGSVSSADRSSVETIGIRGAWKVRRSTRLRNSSSIGSISGEWNAWLTVSRLVLRPSAASRPATSSTACSAPESTTEFGPLTAAMPTSASRSASSGSTSSSDACTATIAPPAGSCCISRPRAATSVAASGSDSTPATCAAAISPIEWPARKSGRTPHDSTRRNSATSTAKSAGCVNAVSSIRSPAKTTSFSGRSRCWSSSAQTASKADANTGNASYNSAPIPAR